MCSCIQTRKVFQGGLSIDVADAAIGLRRASKNEEMWTKRLCFTAVELEKKVTSYLVLDFF